MESLPVMKYNFLLLVVLSYINCEGQSPVYTAHEWGTFTTLSGSNGKLLSGLFLEEEKLPDFVRDFATTHYSKSGGHWNVNPKNPADSLYVYEETEIFKHFPGINVKMETPVIYFYSDAANRFSMEAKVRYKNGGVTQWFPKATQFDMWNAISNYDFSNPSHFGKIEWRFDLLPKDSKSVSYPVASHTWTAPRNTSSNIVCVGTQKEKFLFYRGIGHFEDAYLKVEFNKKGKLLLRNLTQSAIPYLLVYEKCIDGQIRVWGSEEKLAPLKPVFYSKPTTLYSTYQFDSTLQAFANKLTEAGLFQDEAKAMLDTWKSSYFDKPGLKVFWILPRVLTDEILPISFEPIPQNFERVLVARSEILTPEFENKLNTNLSSFIKKTFSTSNGVTSTTIDYVDRFYLAYLERLNYLALHHEELTDEDNEVYNDKSVVGSIVVYPNPTINTLQLSLSNLKGTNQVSLADLTGRILFTQNLPTQSDYEEIQLILPKFSSGVYLLKILNGTTEIVKKVSIVQ